MAHTFAEIVVATVIGLSLAPGGALAHRSLVFLVDMRLKAAPIMCIFLLSTWLSVHVVVATNSWLCDFSFVVVSSFRVLAARLACAPSLVSLELAGPSHTNGRWRHAHWCADTVMLANSMILVVMCSVPDVNPSVVDNKEFVFPEVLRRSVSQAT